jgi:hypothetical protein
MRAGLSGPGALEPDLRPERRRWARCPEPAPDRTTWRVRDEDPKRGRAGGTARALREEGQAEAVDVGGGGGFQGSARAAEDLQVVSRAKVAEEDNRNAWSSVREAGRGTTSAAGKRRASRAAGAHGRWKLTLELSKGGRRVRSRREAGLGSRPGSGQGCRARLSSGPKRRGSTSYSSQ